MWCRAYSQIPAMKQKVMKSYVIFGLSSKRSKQQFFSAKDGLIAIYRFVARERPKTAILFRQRSVTRKSRETCMRTSAFSCLLRFEAAGLFCRLMH